MVGGDTRTATLSLALDATTRANGCLKFIPGSHTAKTTRPHVPIGGSRDDAHAIAIKLDETKEKIVHVEINRGDVSIHDEVRVQVGERAVLVSTGPVLPTHFSTHPPSRSGLSTAAPATTQMATAAPTSSPSAQRSACGRSGSSALTTAITTL
jgi:hypothetical protein